MLKAEWTPSWSSMIIFSRLVIVGMCSSKCRRNMRLYVSKCRWETWSKDMYNVFTSVANAGYCPSHFLCRVRIFRVALMFWTDAKNMFAWSRFLSSTRSYSPCKATQAYTTDSVMICGAFRAACLIMSLSISGGNRMGFISRLMRYWVSIYHR